MKGKGKRILLWAVLLLFSVLTGCGVHESAPSTFQPYYAEPETESTCEICGLVECDPEPTYFDEYGVLYHWDGGRCDEYFIDELYREEFYTTDSTAISWIAFYPYTKELMIEFRESGDVYIYYDVPFDVWVEFCEADSKGGFFNQEIKGQYEYEKY